MALVWHRHDDLTAVAAARLSEVLAEELSERPVLLLLSGGSWFSVLERVCVPTAGALTIGMLDERYSRDPVVNNFAQLTHTTFFSSLPAGVSLLDSRVGEEEDRGTYAARFARGIESWCEVHPDGVVVATLGMGPDGHTAGVFPGVFDTATFEATFVATDAWVHAYAVPPEVNEHTERVTVTLAFLREYVEYAIFFALGKSHQVAALHERALPLSEQPAAIVHDMPFVDIFAEGA